MFDEDELWLINNFAKNSYKNNEDILKENIHYPLNIKYPKKYGSSYEDMILDNQMILRGIMKKIDINNLNEQRLERDIVLVFDIKSEKKFDIFKNYKELSDDPEDYHRCIAREKWQEVVTSMKKDRCIFWNREKNYFTDVNFDKLEKLDNSKYYLPRTSFGDHYIIIDDILKYVAQDKIITNKYDFFMNENWFRTIPYKFVKRRFIELQRIDFIGEKGYINLEKYLGKILNNIEKDEFFLKSIIRDDDIHFTGTIEEFKKSNEHSYAFERVSDLSKFLFSQKLNIIEDKFGKKEYRCFYINGKLKNISRYLDYNEHEIPQKVKNFAFDLTEILGVCVPKDIVIDICEIDDGDVVVVECNSINPAGRFIYNNVNMFFE